MHISNETLDSWTGFRIPRQLHRGLNNKNRALEYALPQRQYGTLRNNLSIPLQNPRNQQIFA